jgi:hypothetical protein
VTTRAYRPAVLLGVNLRTVNRQPVPAIAARLTLGQLLPSLPATRLGRIGHG